MSDDPGAHIAKLYEMVGHLAGIIERTHRPGPVTDVDYSDATKPRIRIQIGTDDEGQPVKGPWVPVVSHAGDRTIHAPVTVGQTMLQLAPDGNFENAVAMHYGFSSKIKSPSTDPNAHVDQFGKVTDTLKQDEWTKAVGDAVSIDLTTDTVTIKGPKIVLAGTVYLGSADANRPLSLKGSVDTRGDVQQGNLATQVFGQ